MKKAVSLAIETIVIVTISLIFLILVMQIVHKGFYKQLDLLAQVDQQYKNQLLEACKAGSDKVLFLIDQYQNNDFIVSAIKNLGSDDDFTLEIKEVSNYGINPADWFQYRTEPVMIPSGECALVGITLTVPSTSVKGSYIFDLLVKNTGGNYGRVEFYVKV